jgi:hypothetical protein
MWSFFFVLAESGADLGVMAFSVGRSESLTLVDLRIRKP